MIDRARIGLATTPGAVTIDAWRVKLFCLATGEADAAASRSGQPIPPTFLKAIEAEHHSSAALLQTLGVPLRGVLHAEQSFEMLGRVVVGDTVEVQRRVADIYDKKAGALSFVVIDTHYRVSGRAVATSRQTVVVRNQATGA